VQNIAEGSQAAGTSKKTELKLTNVARASLEELRLDYEDFLRHRSLPLWRREDQRRAALIARRCATADEVADWVKKQKEASGLHGQHGPGGQGSAWNDGQSSGRMEGMEGKQRSIQSTKSTESTGGSFPEIAANAALVLITVACSLLDRQIAALAAAFEQEGGFTERLYRVRKSRPSFERHTAPILKSL
jgi:four helix bundle suffix protein